MLGRRVILTIPWGVGLLLLLFAVGLTLWFAFVPMHRPIVIFIGSAAIAAGIFLDAANSIQIRHDQQELARAQGRETKVAAALQLIRLWADPALFPVKSTAMLVIREFGDRRSIDDQLRFLEENADKGYLDAVIETMNFFELLGLAVDTGLADEEIVKRYFRALTVHVWGRLNSYVAWRQGESNNPRLFSEFEGLFARWGRL